MLFLGIDLGSSSIKVSLLSGETGKVLAQTQQPEQEMEIHAHQPDWAEQSPEKWFSYIKKGIHELTKQPGIDGSQIEAIGISYQMHGLVLVDKNQEVLRPSIIWCDSRAVEIGNQATQALGEKWCLNHLLNAPGNFTASKLKWVMENEPELYEQIDKVLLPGDYVAMKLSGKTSTTIGGLSEGIFWDYEKESISQELLDYYGFSSDVIPQIVDAFGTQVKLNTEMANELGLKAGIPVSYRAGDQPNNAYSLNVLKPGEVAATAGTSGVVYAVADSNVVDIQSRVNVFAHVNHKPNNKRLGVLLCVNGTGIQYAWLKRTLGQNMFDYRQLNAMAEEVEPGSEGILCFPFGNGAERMLVNSNVGGQFANINFNIHDDKHMCRAAQEGIAFALYYGMHIMKQMGMDLKVIRAGYANLFQSKVFAQTLATISSTTIELYNTDGAEGAARGAAVGMGYYTTNEQAFKELKCIEKIVPQDDWKDKLESAYHKWLGHLEHLLENN